MLGGQHQKMVLCGKKDEAPIDLPRGNRNTWNAGESIQPSVLKLDDEAWLMVYMGLDSNFSGASLGIATSEDGLSWIFFGEDPVIHHDSIGADFLNRPQMILHEDSTIYLYFNGLKIR